MVSYTPHDWQPHETVTADDLDRMETGISDMSPPTQATVTQIITDTGGAAYAAIGDVATAAVGARQAAYARPATDFGVVLDSAADQSSKLQDALDAAATDGFDLLLPASTIVCEGALSWSPHMHSIIGNHISALDFSHSTIEGPVIKLDGSRGPLNTSGAVVNSGIMSGLYITGPTDANTTVDAIQIKGHVNNDNSVYGVSFDHVVITGFKRQEVFGNYAWLVDHRACYFSKAVDAAVDYLGTMTTGENISYDACSFANGGGGFRADVLGTGLDVAFRSCSFDYNTGPALKASAGAFTFDGCHLENGKMGGTLTELPPNFVELTSTADSGNTHRPSVTFNGGVVVTPNTDYTGPLGQAVVVQTDTKPQAPPITVIANGLSLANGDTDGPPILFHDEITQTNVDGAAYPIVRYTGNLSYRGARSMARLGVASCLNNDPGFEGTITSGSPAWNANLGKWYTSHASNVTIDSTESAVGSQSCKLDFGSAAPSGPVLTQNMTVPVGKTLHVSFWVKTSGWAVGALSQVEVKFYDIAGNQTQNVRAADLSSIASTQDWAFVGCWLKIPAGSVMGTLQARVQGSTGTMWIDDLQVCPI